MLKKIVLYHNEIVNPGGAERLLLEEYDFLKRKGIEIWLLTFKVNQNALFDHKVENLQVLNCGSNFLSKFLSLRKKLNEIKPDLVISATGGSELYLATACLGISYSLHIHGTIFRFEKDVTKFAIIHRKVFNEIRNSVEGHKEFIPLRLKGSIKTRIKLEFGALIDYIGVKKAKEVFVLTTQGQWEVEKLYNRTALVATGCLDPKIMFYKQTCDIKKEAKLKNSIIILSVSRLDPRKRIDVLIKAFAEVASEISNLVLVIVGTGPDEKKLKSFVIKSNLSDKVIFTGYVPDKNLWNFYISCDLFATPAWADFDIAPFEALTFGKKVVWSSEMADFPTLSDYVTVAEPSPSGFAKGIRVALSNKVEKKPNMSSYTWDKYFQSIFRTKDD